MYSAALTSVLTGASLRQLQHWRGKGTGPLLRPEYGSRPCLYSFQDVVALRMVVNLRRERSLQGIRRAVGYLAEHCPETHLSRHKLRSDKTSEKSIVWITEDGDFVDVVKRPGQEGIRVIMAQILDEFTTQTGRVVPNLFSPANGIEIDANRCSGYPTITETRIPYDQIASLADDGLTGDDIRYWYPGVADESIRGAVALAGQVRLVLAT